MAKGSGGFLGGLAKLGSNLLGWGGALVGAVQGAQQGQSQAQAPTVNVNVPGQPTTTSTGKIIEQWAPWVLGGAALFALVLMFRPRRS